MENTTRRWFPCWIAKWSNMENIQLQMWVCFHPTLISRNISRHITLLNYIPKHNFPIVLPRCQVISNCDVIYVAMNYATDNRLRIPLYAILSRDLLAINSVIRSLQKRPIKKHINAACLSRLASSRQICFECHECTLTELLICESGSGCDIQYVN